MINQTTNGPFVYDIRVMSWIIDRSNEQMKMSVSLLHSLTFQSLNRSLYLIFHALSRGSISM